MTHYYGISHMEYPALFLMCSNLSCDVFAAPLSGRQGGAAGTARLEVVGEWPLWGIVESLAVLRSRFAGIQRDAVLVTFRYGTNGLTGLQVEAAVSSGFPRQSPLQGISETGSAVPHCIQTNPASMEHASIIVCVQLPKPATAFEMFRPNA